KQRPGWLEPPGPLVHTRSSRIRTSQRRARRDRSHGWPPGPRYNNTASSAALARRGVCRSRRRVSRSALQPPTLVARLPALRQLPGFSLALLPPCVLPAPCGHEDRKPIVAARQPRVSPRSVRITMDALHQLGGVPAGWQLTPLPGDAEAGRQTFQDLGCPSCHRIAGEPFAGQATRGPGPDLTGNGAHPPPAGLPASSSNPDAVLADGPGYVSRDGHSAMPAYPDLTVTQLEDLVAYLSSLTSGDPHAGHMMAAAGVSSVDNRPTPPETQAKSFFVQTY